MSRHWLVTWNNPTLGDQQFFDVMTDLCVNQKKIRYAAWQREVGAQGTPHFQMWVVLTRDQRCTYFGNSLGWAGAHAECQRGTDAQAYEYVTKVETRVAGPWEVGKRESVGQGTRNDYKAFVEDAFVLSRAELSKKHPGMAIRYGRGVDRELAARFVPRSVAPVVTLFFGPSGCGKTHAAVKWAKDHGYDFFISSMGEWADGYTQQKVFIWDEVDKDFDKVGFQKVLRLLDKYPYSVNVKGQSMVPFNSPFIFLTASEPPRVWVAGGRQDYLQLERRIQYAYYRADQTQPWESVPMWKPVKAEPVEPTLIVLDSDEEEEVIQDEEFQLSASFFGEWFGTPVPEERQVDVSALADINLYDLL